MKKKQKIKAICQPGFFAKQPKYRAHLTKNPGSHQIAVRHRTILNVTRTQKNKLILPEKREDCENFGKLKHPF